MASYNPIIENWQAGDQQAAELLYEQYRLPVFRLAYGLLLDQADAEEVVQDTLLYALNHISRYDPQRASFKTWLNRIAVSRCRDKRRRKWLPRFSLSAWREKGGDVADKRPLPEHITLQNEDDTYLWQAIQTLSPKLREVIILRFWGGHTFREIAEIVDCPLPTAQSRAQFAYKQLRAVYRQEDHLGKPEVHES